MCSEIHFNRLNETEETEMDLVPYITYTIYVQEAWLSEPKWQETYFLSYVLNEDLNPPVYPRCLIRVLIIRTKKLCILG